ncbi:enoyl-CoA hydratase/isomerase family protein [Extensimonas vulgaris]|uniref:Enoyl-CoA hydratase n=1 Tax=Extensimonas vulgaris TaxID=1031594 RepID=A0A369AEH9_9BURK|nr:enoyl-CoA hydratase-related protein [Extensimonas vulgaris]RCX07573.1 enoyl-CoA hydratase [Extensimonas vulgaris]TWI41463.1 2-(1,2-epoxy-1,2-dihydrophenyl)acetyl-CoA isomerase [Extensimonas vulgaris]TXD12907.1 enoyl-CoA hydratase [Extensimonas vulgaris]
MTATAESPVLIERQGAVVTLCLNRPAALNAVDYTLAEAFCRAVKDISTDASVRAVVLRGAGKGFVAGGDLATLRANPVQGASDILTLLNEALPLLTAMDAPLIAQVHGVAAGAGLSLMLLADFILVAEGTRFAPAYIHLGTCCDVGMSWNLPRIVGLRRALEITMLGEPFDAAEALQMGLVNRVLPADQLEAATQELAQRLAAGPTLAYGALKRLMRQSFERSFAAQLDAEKQSFVHCMGTEDFRAGVEAFYARQKPTFQAR